MRVRRSLAATTFAGSLLFLPGCFDGDNSPSSTDDAEQAAIEYVVLDEEAPLADADVVYWDDGDGAVALTPIATTAWRRELLSLDRSVSIEIEQPAGEPARADVTYRWDATGILHLWACADSVRTHYEKDFEDLGVRRLLLERARRTGDRNRGWRLIALSGVSIESPGTTRQIRSVRIQAGAVDETVTNVTDLVRVQDVLTLPGGEEVLVTVDTGDASDQVYLHLRHRRARMALASNGDGTFSGRFVSSDVGGPRHLVVDVLSEGTIYDDVAPYDNVAWGIPWRIEGDRPAAE